MSNKASPTKTIYDELQHAYDTFNLRLFGGTLDRCLITLQRQANTMGYLSYNRFIATSDKDSFTHELALNPEYFGVTPILETLATVTHEMCHLWQRMYGTPSNKTYHNTEWADKMESIGLMPSSTGRVGGKRTGQKVADYPMKDGLFLAVCKELFLDNYNVSWYDRSRPKNATDATMISNYNFAQQYTDLPPEALNVPLLNAYGINTDTDEPTGFTATSIILPSNIEQQQEKPLHSKMKWQCPKCKSNAWGKPKLNIVCGDCQEKYEIVF